MTEVDKRIEELGFKLTDENMKFGYIVYENEAADQRVELNYNGEIWLIYSASKSMHDDFYGDQIREPRGMTYEECKAFLDNIEELKEI